MAGKIAVAMSGGVDSSVAAALAVEKYGAENVFGVTMKLFCHGGFETRNSKLENKSCCSLDAINDAATVCKQLGIPHYVVNLEKEFESEIIDDFVSEYSAGRTPNPCVRCNSLIKFKPLLEKVQQLGADLLVTGHYARILCEHKSDNTPLRTATEGQAKDKNTDGKNYPLDTSYKLLRGVDEHKDQSYFLYNLNQKQLSHIWFPLGELTKVETRKLADKYNLKTAQKTESQDICFVTTTTQDFLAYRIKVKPGDIVDTKGKKIGKHEGLPFYTIGQRKGLGGGFVEPMYVVGLNIDKNELIVGKEEQLYDNEMLVSDVTWTNEAPELPAEMKVNIRYNSESAPAVLSSSSVAKDLLVHFSTPQKAITPGQTAVFYLKEEVIGGGLISSTRHG